MMNTRRAAASDSPAVGQGDEQAVGASSAKKGCGSCLEEMEEDQQALVVEPAEGAGWLHPVSVRTTTHDWDSASAAIAYAPTAADASFISAVFPATR
jgi:hypothetical protein